MAAEKKTERNHLTILRLVGNSRNIKVVQQLQLPRTATGRQVAETEVTVVVKRMEPPRMNSGRR